MTISDPWQIAPTTRSDRGLPTALVIALSAVIGSVGIVARLLDQGFDGRALTLAAIAVGWALIVDRCRATTRRWALLALVPAALIAVLATASTSGRLPTMVLLVATLLAHAALSGPELAPLPPRANSVAGLAIAPLIGLQIAWYRSEPRIETVVLLGLSTALLLAFHLFADPAVRAEHALWRGLTYVGNAIASVLIFLGALVTLYLPGIVLAPIERLRRRSRTTTWREIHIDRAEFSRDAPFPFRSTEGRVRDRRNAIGLVVLSAVIASVLLWPFGGSTSDDRTVFERAEEVRFSDLPAFDGVTFADALKAEQDEFSSSLVPDARTGVGSPDFDGEFTTVRDGVRITPTPACDDCPTVRLWLLGGSAAFGLGQRDGHTIAARLVDRAAADGLELIVTNLAVPGWTLWQEFQSVTARLTLTDERPDLVVFYDGYNDTVGTVINSALYGIDESQPSMLITEEILEFSDRDIDPAAAGSADKLGALAARRYSATASAAQRTAAEYGFDTRFYFQPDAYASPVQLDAVPDLFDGGDASRSQYINDALHAASEGTTDVATNLRHVFDDLSTPVFADLVHTNELGARIVADAIYDDMSRDLVATAGS